MGGGLRRFALKSGGLGVEVAGSPAPGVETTQRRRRVPTTNTPPQSLNERHKLVALMTIGGATNVEIAGALDFHPPRDAHPPVAGITGEDHRAETRVIFDTESLRRLASAVVEDGGDEAPPVVLA